jgi:hypothetical protein
MRVWDISQSFAFRKARPFRRLSPTFSSSAPVEAVVAGIASFL